MALSQSALLEVLDALKASDSTDVIRHALQVMLQQLIEAEATAFIGAEPHQRTEERITQRNGTRSKTITTAAGDCCVFCSYGDAPCPPMQHEVSTEVGKRGGA